jgi:hypothetical protein
MTRSKWKILLFACALAFAGCPKKSGPAPAPDPGTEEVTEEEAMQETGEEEEAALPDLPVSGEDSGPEVCMPACDGKDCGDDGCSGSCGTCAAGTCIDGKCCLPDCTDKACGDDACGGTCGACPDKQECHKGLCRPPCDGNDFTAATNSCYWRPAFKPSDPRGDLFYQELTANSYPFSALRVEIRQYKPWDGPMVPGTYSLKTTSYNDCAICVQLFDQCTMKGCTNGYLATDGEIEIKQLAGASGPFEAVLHDVQMREARVDMEWNTDLVAGGKTWCLDDKPLYSAKVDLAFPEPQCVKEGNGTLVDKNIGDFKLMNCAGHTPSLHGLCGKVKAMWLVLVASWCSACAEFVPQAYAYYQQKKAKGVQLWVIIGEDINQKAPDLADCKAYADTYGLDPEMVFIDPGYQETFKYVYPYGFGGIPYNILLDGDNMAYVWSQGLKGDLGSIINSLTYN